jgi:hypothetical protein
MLLVLPVAMAVSMAVSMPVLLLLLSSRPVTGVSSSTSKNPIFCLFSSSYPFPFEQPFERLLPCQQHGGFFG